MKWLQYQSAFNTEYYWHHDQTFNLISEYVFIHEFFSSFHDNLNYMSPPVTNGCWLSLDCITHISFENCTCSSLLDVQPEIYDALHTNSKPVVALESTIITHGMPFPHNLNTAIQVEEIVRNQVGMQCDLMFVCFFLVFFCFLSVHFAVHLQVHLCHFAADICCPIC